MGFKSFGRKTVFDFTPGLTGIIGPNGSGKSNVCDAIRWVLGEQSAKALRGTKMPDVIFAGSPDFRPSAFAQVKMVLDNEDKAMPIDFSEVSIARQLYRSGESNYILNGTRTLLSSVKELLMDTGIGKDGYSVIGQGDIDDIIFQRTQARRALVEEAAGITKFKHRKQNALTKLEHTRANMTRVQDLMSDIETRLGPLAEQAEKTRKYQQLSAQIKELEIDLLAYDLHKFYGDKENIISMRNGLMLKIQEIEKFLSDVDEKKAGAHAKFDEFQSTLNEKQEKVKEANVLIDNKKESAAKYREDIKSHTARSQAIKEELDNIEVSIQNSEAEVQHAQEELNDEQTKEIELSSIMSEVNDNIQAVKKELNEKIKEQSQGRESAFKAASRQSDCRNRINTANQQIQLLERQLEKGNTDVAIAQGNLERLKDESKKMKIQIDELAKTIEENKLSYSNDLAKLNKVEKDYTKVNDELSAITDQIKISRTRSNLLEELRHSNESGIYRGVQAILALKETGKLQGIHGIVGDLIKVPSGYEIAFETALGTSIQDIITQDSNTAKKAIDSLKQTKAGRATFLPLDIMTAPPTIENPKVKGCLGVALDLIQFDAKYYTVMSNMLGRILIFDNLDNAVEFTKRNRNFTRIVTIDGEVVHKSGAMTGGGETKKAGGILSRKREQEELDEKLKVLSSKEIKLKTLLNNLIKERQILTSSTRDKDELIRKNENSLAFFQKIFNQKNEELTAKDADFKTIADDRTEITNKLAELRKEHAAAEAELHIVEKENEDLADKLREILSITEEIQNRLNSLNDIYNGHNIELAKIKERQKAINKEIEAAKKRRKEAVDRKERANDQIVDLNKLTNEATEKLQALQREIDDLTKQKEEYEADVASVQTEYSKMSKELEQLDRLYQSRARMQDSTKSKLNELDVKLAELNTKINAKEVSLRDEYLIDPETYVLDNKKYESREEIAGKTSALNFERLAMEPINPLAIEDYEKTKEQYDFLNNQINDLTEAASSLEQVIAEIDKISSERFMETFNQINIAFGGIFEVLFPSGSGTLKLTEKDNPLESNVDIVCKLPGKKLTTLELFSGGEKSLISLALLFAILQVKPPAFCLLDEVEAALDEANVKRFNRMLKTFSNKTQFLVITHNKHTMQTVDVIYGITMQKGGISRQISIRLEDEEKIKEFTVGKGKISEKNLPAAAGAEQ